MANENPFEVVTEPSVPKKMAELPLLLNSTVCPGSGMTTDAADVPTETEPSLAMLYCCRTQKPVSG